MRNFAGGMVLVCLPYSVSKGPRPVQLSRSPIEGGAVDSLDQETRTAIDQLRFREAQEQHFREGHFANNVPRARSATAIYLAMIFVVTAINLLGGLTPFTQAILDPIYVLRLAVACPALLVILLATYVPAMRRHYQAIATFAVVVNGLAVMTISALAAGSGQPQFQMGDVLVIVYATLTIPTVILFEALLSFLGLGVQSPLASLGSLVADGASEMQSHPHLLIIPAVFLALITYCFNYLGDGLRDAFDPRDR